MLQHNKDKIRSNFFYGILFCAALVFFTIFNAAFSYASTCTCCDCCVDTVIPYHQETRQAITDEHKHIRDEVFGSSYGNPSFRTVLNPTTDYYRLRHHEKWLVHTFFEKYILPDLMLMTEQLTTVMMHQMLIIGTFFDAKQQLETQLLFQKLTAQAHKDYQPDFNMCAIGGNTRSLASAEFNADFTRMVLNKQFMDRQLGNGTSIGSGGPDDDRASDAGGAPTVYNRLGYFLHNTCDNNDLNKLPGRINTGLILCAATGVDTNGWVNRDIDWTNTVMGPRTINVDYTTTFSESASDNERIFSMSNYLYGHRVFTRPDGTLLEYQRNFDNFLDSRAVTAKRSVAQNSFNAIVGLKSRGTRMVDPTDSGDPREMSSEETSSFLRFYMVELGFPLGDPLPYQKYMFQKDPALEPPSATDLIRDEMSYYAQMEVLAKKIYQRPEFYTDLYDKPANIKRKSAAMQAIKLMLERDIFDSQLRAEAITSMILELKVVEEQQYIENMLGLMKERSK